ncbi:MAG: hypothetical protein K9N09_02285 [Candidatus Cloacimonetes bacterium]|nr:hypothetical protein [Candidatus Cloacimonadota bacterium]MCF7813372.1 hypothetical protein [Candidatus Cloacimonadota bacterium]MCF7867503.1 hypothetical protein [Candidatus Cloacimonadota bacterium]
MKKSEFHIRSLGRELSDIGGLRILETKIIPLICLENQKEKAEHLLLSGEEIGT